VRAGGLLDVPTKEIPPFAAKMKNRVTCFMRFLAIGGCHAALLVYGPSLWSWKGLGLAYLVYSVTGMIGITLGYHRLLTHKSFKTYKAVEYFVAWVGAQSGQGDPIEWVSTHRCVCTRLVVYTRASGLWRRKVVLRLKAANHAPLHQTHTLLTQTHTHNPIRPPPPPIHSYHHMHTDTPLDPHSPYEGFWWSHITWLAGTEASFLDYANVPDLKSQLFYRCGAAVSFV
jgi:fatty-acid desaturase